MSDFPYDRRFVYPTRRDALEGVEAQEPRINQVGAWLLDHGAPRPFKIQVVCSDFPGKPQAHFCVAYLVFNGIDDDKTQAHIRLTLYHVLQRPDIALMNIARDLGSDDPSTEDPRRRKMSEQIVWERWIEPEPIRPPQPVPRPFGPHIDEYDSECMLSNSTDQFKVGALWTEPDETLWKKEKTYWSYIVYFHWRPISTVALPAPEE